MASILGRARRPCGCARRHGSAHASAPSRVAPQGEHCQSCSSAVQPQGFCGAQALWRVESCFETREKAMCCRVEDARSTQRWSQVGQALEDPRVRRREEGSRQSSRNAPRIAPVPRTTFWQVGISKTREVHSRRSGWTHRTSAAVHRKQGKGSAAVLFPRVCNNTQRFT